MTHFARLLTLVLVILFACTAGLTACAPANEAVLAATPEPTSTATATPKQEPTPAPTPTPAPSPTPTHQPELSLEEERALLGVKDENDIVFISTLMIMLYSQTDDTGKYVRRIAWFTESKDLNGNRGLYNRWGREKLYDIPLDASNRVREYLPLVTPANKRLEGSEILDIYGIYGIEDFYKENGIDFQIPRELRYYFSESHINDRDYSLPMTDAMDLYIRCTPKEYRTSWKDFDESLTFFESPQP